MAGFLLPPMTTAMTQGFTSQMVNHIRKILPLKTNPSPVFFPGGSCWFIHIQSVTKLLGGLIIPPSPPLQLCNFLRSKETEEPLPGLFLLKVQPGNKNLNFQVQTQTLQLKEVQTLNGRYSGKDVHIATELSQFPQLSIQPCKSRQEEKQQIPTEVGQSCIHLGREQNNFTHKG